MIFSIHGIYCTFDGEESEDKPHPDRMQAHRKLTVLTNLSTCQYINQFRLEKGKMLLSKNELNVSEVAYDCGFSDPGYFSKLFSATYGQSPLHFKRTSEA